MEFFACDDGIEGPSEVTWVVDGPAWATGGKVEDSGSLQDGISPHFPVESASGAAPEESVIGIGRVASIALG